MKDKYFSISIVVEIILVAFIYLSTTMGWYSAASIAFAVTFLVLLGYIFLTKNFKDLKTWILITICVFNVIIDFLIHTTGKISFDYYKKVIMFSTFVLLISYCSTIKVNAKTLRFVQYVPIVLSVYTFFSYYYFGNNNMIAQGITLGFSNPNFTGMWLLHLFVFDVINVFDSKNKKIIRILSLILAIVMLQLINLTKARSSMIGAFVFGMLLFVGYIKKMQLSKFTTILCIIFPIIFIFIYFSLVNQDWFTEFFSFMISEGKTLTSRNKIWKNALEVYSQSPIIGVYYLISEGTGQSQLHNAHLDVLVSYGPIVFLLFLYILFKASKVCYQKNNTALSFISVAGFLAIMISGTFEAALVAGAMGLNIFTASLLLLANSKEENSLIGIKEK